MYFVNCSKLELEKVVDELRSGNQALQQEVDFTSDFLTNINHRN